MPLRLRRELFHSIVSSATLNTTPVTIATAIVGQVAGCYGLIITVGGTVNVTLTDTSAVALSQAFQLSTSTNIIVPLAYNTDPWWITGVGLGLQLSASAAVQVNADIWWLQGA